METDIKTDIKTVKSELADMKDMLMKLIKQLDEKKDPAIECTHEAFKSRVEALETDNADLRAKNVELRALLEESRSTSARANDMQSSGIQIPRQTSRQPVETTITTSNRYSALSSRGTDDEEPVITGSQSSRGDEAPETTGHRSTRRANQTSRRVPPNQRDGSRDQPEPEQTQRAAIMIIGDSIIKQIDPKKLSKKTVYKRSFPGKTCDQISDEIDGIHTDVEPSHVIIHAGTNNMPAESADSCVTKIENLAMKTRNTYQNARIGISSLTHREDINVSMKQSEVNNKLKEMAHRNNFDFIDNSHIDGSCLNSSKLHLNAKGSAYLATSFIKFIRPSGNGNSYRPRKPDFHISSIQQLGKILMELGSHTPNGKPRSRYH